MGFEFRVPQKAVIKKGDKFLIAKRSPDVEIYPNKWDFFGGKLETGESPSEGLR